MRSLGRRFLAAFLALTVVVVGGAVGYYAIGAGRWSFWDCVYMTVITVTTVGFGEVLSGMEHVTHARAFTMLLLMFGTGSIVYFASVVTAFIIEGDLRDALFEQRRKKRMKTMHDHVVVCGAGTTGKNVIEELLKANIPVIAIDLHDHVLKELLDRYPKAPYSYVVGDATDDDVLSQLNLLQARGLIAALSSDKDNLYLVVSARQVNSQLRIVARCAENSHVEKIRRSGADAVVSPNFIGGMRLVSELLRPTIVEFLDAMLRDQRATYRIEEVALNQNYERLGESFGEARIRERFGMTVLALRGTNKEYVYNPEPKERLAQGVVLVVLGTREQVEALRRALA
jgi:voltage-gated potassium channel